jgi:hypothetical protein
VILLGRVEENPNVPDLVGGRFIVDGRRNPFDLGLSAPVEPGQAPAASSDPQLSP